MFLGGSVPIGSEALQPEKKAFLDRLWQFLWPSSMEDTDDPQINPVAEGSPSLVGLGCRRVLIWIERWLKDNRFSSSIFNYYRFKIGQFTLFKLSIRELVD